MNEQLAEIWQKHKKLLLGAALLMGLIFFFYNQTDEKAQNKNEKEQWAQVEEIIPSAKDEKAEKEEPSILKVDIKGAVQKPGVYEFKQGDRVTDVIGMAGGLSEAADSTQVNMAQLVEDEMVVYIPIVGEETQAVQAAADGMSGGGKEGALIDINKATLEELQELPGIGPSKAAAIIAKRDELGSFKTIEDLKLVSGIGEKTYEKLKDLISS
ncbi:competence protein ComE [Pradoshia eiseniae]|uniref:Competence protein ComE n=1 Tax=Pradoshia eiseniae TaxID=2064768 RepID=A0A2S7N2Y4_9BACI|nr:helix-hairpin-helix domain-containing protein [Pradoshia eiseniae]PQD96441.1 competence protein ComE [Pradoshia eiseniae]